MESMHLENGTKISVVFMVRTCSNLMSLDVTDLWKQFCFQAMRTEAVYASQPEFALSI